jgi:hypothetical protein
MKKVTKDQASNVNNNDWSFNMIVENL